MSSSAVAPPTPWPSRWPRSPPPAAAPRPTWSTSARSTRCGASWPTPPSPPAGSTSWSTTPGSATPRPSSRRRTPSTGGSCSRRTSSPSSWESQAAVEAMRACGAEGHLVNISSVAALRSDSGVYGATKHAVNCINNTLRRELMDDPSRSSPSCPAPSPPTSPATSTAPSLQGLVSVAGDEIPTSRSRRARGCPTRSWRGPRPPSPATCAPPRTWPRRSCGPSPVPAGVHLSEIVVRPKRDLNL
jgi:hypothetical protein